LNLISAKTCFLAQEINNCCFIIIII